MRIEAVHGVCWNTRRCTGNTSVAWFERFITTHVYTPHQHLYYIHAGCFLAFETKDVKMEELNDSQAIGMCIYNVFILSAIGVALNFIFSEKNQTLYITTSAILLVSKSQMGVMDGGRSIQQAVSAKPPLTFSENVFAALA